MTFSEAYTSLLSVYKHLMFPISPYKTGWTMSQIDEMDVRLFYEIMQHEDIKTEKEVYLNEIW